MRPSTNSTPVSHSPLHFAGVLLFALLSVLLCFAGDKHKDEIPPDIPEVAKLRLVTAYQKALLAQVPFQQAQEAFNKAVAAYNEVSAATAKENNLPEGTTFQIDVNTQAVKIVPPPPKPAEPAKPTETKPAEPKK